MLDLYLCVWKYTSDGKLNLFMGHFSSPHHDFSENLNHYMNFSEKNCFESIILFLKIYTFLLNKPNKGASSRNSEHESGRKVKQKLFFFLILSPWEHRD